MAVNTGALKGLTIFITGASRGIGKAIALKCARDGAKIVIAAKTAQPHPKLPGTIYTAAKEIEEAGGECLPCVVDVRNEEDVDRAIKSTIEKFGGLDILVNNASAISLTDTLTTPMKRYDLMNEINTRGTYLCSQKAIPHIKQSSNPHILNLSPPLVMKPHWFKGHVAYSIAKYGMSLCVLGMSAEFKSQGVLVNALWPRTGISTAAIEMIAGKESQAYCRKPDIMADAAYLILTNKAKENSGQFYIDDEVITRHGITDLDQYSCVPGNLLAPDFFLDDEHLNKPFLTKISLTGLTQDSNSNSSDSNSNTSSSSDSKISKIFDSIKPLITPELLKEVNGSFLFIVEDATQPNIWLLNLKEEGVVKPANSDTNADVTMKMNEKNFIDMFAGKLNPTMAFMGGKLKLTGNMMLALKLEKLMKQMQKSKL